LQLILVTSLIACSQAILNMSCVSTSNHMSGSLLVDVIIALTLAIAKNKI